MAPKKVTLPQPPHQLAGDLQAREVHFGFGPVPKPYERCAGPIYHAVTTSFAPLVQILQVAYRQPQVFDLVSVHEHLPNQDMDAYNRDKGTRHGPVEVQILFAKNFYEDERHALGYYVVAPDEKTADGQALTEIFFTACEDSDLAAEKVVFGEGEGEGEWAGRWFAKNGLGKEKDMYFDRWEVIAETWEKRVRDNRISAKSVAWA